MSNKGLQMSCAGQGWTVSPSARVRSHGPASACTPRCHSHVAFRQRTRFGTGAFFTRVFRSRQTAHICSNCSTRGCSIASDGHPGAFVRCSNLQQQQVLARRALLPAAPVRSGFHRQQQCRPCAALEADSLVPLGLDFLTFLSATVLVIPLFKSVKASPILGFLFSGVVLGQLG